jgi:hypothetical protein
MTFVNSVVPIVTKKITKAENWDFPATMVQNQVWRNYLAKILNVAIFTIIQIEMARGANYFNDASLTEFVELHSADDASKVKI